MIDNDDVSRITVIENNQDVINLVWPTYMMNTKCVMRYANAKTIPEQQMKLLGKIDRVWLDLWNTDDVSTVPERWEAIKKWSSVCDWVGVSAFKRKQVQWAI